MTARKTTPRKRLPAAERRELIAQAALEQFAIHGYHGAGIDEIARRAGVSPPVVYDHFASKAQLHVALLERTRDELLAMWTAAVREDDADLDAQVRRAFDAWATYVQTHPYAPRMFFRETTSVPEIAAAHAEIVAAANRPLALLIGAAMGGPDVDLTQLEMVAQVVRGGLTELAVWWSEHPEVEREAIVATAVDVVWTGLERVSRRA